MTLTNENRTQLFLGNGVTREWPFSFVVPAAETLKVYWRENATADFMEILPNFYTVTLQETGGLIVYPITGTPIASGEELLIQRVVPYTQETDIKNQSRFFADVVTRGLNWIVMQTQQLADDLGRTVRFRPVNEPQTQFPELTPRADTVVSFDENSILFLRDVGSFPPGPRGPRGPTGPTGPRGPRGFDGPKGDPGNFVGLYLSGIAADVSLLPPPDSVPNQQWGVTGDGITTIYLSFASTWQNLGAITSPTAFPVANTIFVQENGNNLNSGSSLATAVRHIERALELATLREEPTLIEWYPDQDVVTQGHLDMPDGCVIIAKHRTVFVRPEPGFEERNVFRMGDGCFLEGVMFEGWRVDSLTDPTSGFAVSFRPGALIRRVPYAHKIAVRNEFPGGAGGIPPPLDPENGNPLVPRGGGVMLADGLVCSQYSPFPNIMAWGATPVTYNGLSYVARRGGLINAVSAVSMWSHKHFMALDGGQLVLSGCETQFGDWMFHAKGYREILNPAPTAAVLTTQGTAASAIEDAQAAIIDAMWLDLTTSLDPGTGQPWAQGWTAADEAFTRGDAAIFLQCIRWALLGADATPMQNFARGLFDTMGQPVFAADKLGAFLRSFAVMRDQINGLGGVGVDAAAIVTQLVAELNATLTSPPKRKEVSRISAIQTKFTAIRRGVALFKIPPAEPAGSIADGILEEDDGVVVVTGQDDYGNALLARGPNGTLEVDAVFGLKGALFEDAVRQAARKMALMGSF